MTVNRILAALPGRIEPPGNRGRLIYAEHVKERFFLPKHSIAWFKKDVDSQGAQRLLPDPHRVELRRPNNRQGLKRRRREAEAVLGEAGNDI